MDRAVQRRAGRQGLLVRLVAQRQYRETGEKKTSVPNLNERFSRMCGQGRDGACGCFTDNSAGRIFLRCRRREMGRVITIVSHPRKGRVTRIPEALVWSSGKPAAYLVGMTAFAGFIYDGQMCSPAQPLHPRS